MIMDGEGVLLLTFMYMNQILKNCISQKMPNYTI